MASAMAVPPLSPSLQLLICRCTSEVLMAKLIALPTMLELKSLLSAIKVYRLYDCLTDAQNSSAALP
jgi:hypothetical protein